MARSVSVPASFVPRMGWRRMAIERKGFTLTLPTVMERRTIRIKRRPRRVVTMMTLLSVTIFIKSHCKLFNGQLTMIIDNFSMLILPLASSPSSEVRGTIS
jgi:hypothetical protein